MECPLKPGEGLPAPASPWHRGFVSWLASEQKSGPFSTLILSFLNDTDQEPQVWCVQAEGGFSQRWGRAMFLCGRNQWLPGCTKGLNLSHCLAGTDFGVGTVANQSTHLEGWPSCRGFSLVFLMRRFEQTLCTAPTRSPACSGGGRLSCLWVPKMTLIPTSLWECSSQPRHISYLESF